jgi:hypothetical protein
MIPGETMLSEGARRRYADFYSSLYDEGVCLYCGLPSTRKDPAIPIAFARTAMQICRQRGRKLFALICAECCAFTGYRVFHTLSAKRRYIQGRIREKYRKVLALPFWSDGELDSLDDRLRGSTSAVQYKKFQAMVRLIWPRRPDSLAELVAFYSRKEGILFVYVPSPFEKRRDDYEAKMRPLLVELDAKFVGATAEMAGQLNVIRIPTHTGESWTAASLQATLWRLGLTAEPGRKRAQRR